MEIENEEGKLTEIERIINISVNADSISGDLTIPKNAKGIVIFSHGSGSSRLSPRNRYVARVLNMARIATFLVDLLTDEEEKIDQDTAALRFDIDFLTERLLLVTDWVIKEPSTKDLEIGYFGASTGAASALVAASKLTDKIKAIVSRGGRPDLATEFLSGVFSPTLLIVGENDPEVLEMNKQAFVKLATKIKRIVVISGATHLFEEKGALIQVAKKAKNWFEKYLLTSYRLVILF